MQTVAEYTVQKAAKKGTFEVAKTPHKSHHNAQTKGLPLITPRFQVSVFGHTRIPSVALRCSVVAIWFAKPSVVLGAPDKYLDHRLSPDGQSVMMELADARTQRCDLSIHELSRESRTRLTNGPADDGSVVWSPDGRRMAFFHFGSLSTPMFQKRSPRSPSFSIGCSALD
jgi:Tol biopolymer transport system component